MSVPVTSWNVTAISTSKTSLVLFNVETTAAKASSWASPFVLSPSSQKLVYSAVVDIAILRVRKIWSLASLLKEVISLIGTYSFSVKHSKSFFESILTFLS